MKIFVFWHEISKVFPPTCFGQYEGRLWTVFGPSSVVGPMGGALVSFWGLLTTSSGTLPLMGLGSIPTSDCLGSMWAAFGPLLGPLLWLGPWVGPWCPPWGLLTASSGTLPLMALGSISTSDCLGSMWAAFGPLLGPLLWLGPWVGPWCPPWGLLTASSGTLPLMALGSISTSDCLGSMWAAFGPLLGPLLWLGPWVGPWCPPWGLLTASSGTLPLMGLGSISISDSSGSMWAAFGPSLGPLLWLGPWVG